MLEKLRCGYSFVKGPSVRQLCPVPCALYLGGWKRLAGDSHGPTDGFKPGVIAERRVVRESDEE